MNASLFSAIGRFLVQSKTGRMILLTGVLGLLCFLVPMVAARRKAPESGTSPEIAAKAAGEADLPPSPQGIGETLTLGQKYDALITRWGGDLSSTKVGLDATRKEIEGLRTRMQDERAVQDREKKDLESALRKLRDGLKEAVSPPPASPEASAPDPAGPVRTADPAGAGSGGALRTIDLGALPTRDKKEIHRPVRIPTAAGGRATLLNGVFAPVSGEPSPIRLRFDAAILGPNKARIPLRNSTVSESKRPSTWVTDGPWGPT